MWPFPNLCTPSASGKTGIEDFTLSPGELTQIRALDQNRSWILDVPNLTEVYRLHNIPVSQ